MSLFALSAATAQLFVSTPAILSPSAGASPALPMEQRSFAPAAVPASTTTSASDAADVAARMQAVCEVADLGALPADWDGYGAPAPDPASVRSAIGYLLVASVIGRWEHTLHADGRVILELSEAKRYIELTFGGDDQVVVYKRIGDNVPTPKVVSFAELTADPSLTAI